MAEASKLGDLERSRLRSEIAAHGCGSVSMVRINTIVATRYAVKHTSPTARRCWARKVPDGQRLMFRG